MLGLPVYTLYKTIFPNEYSDLSPVHKNRDVKVGEESRAGQRQGVATQSLKSHKPEKARLSFWKVLSKAFFGKTEKKKTHTLAVKSAAVTCTSPAVFCGREKDENSFAFVKISTFCPSCTATLFTASRFSNLYPLSDCKETIQNWI